ncbi:MAG TPA: universal stress protein [Gaiellaceae bacterium]|nr:universal stress protein [Gaiellaceae bacterium]
MKHIVLGYDATPASERALERTAELAKAFGAKVTVTSVARVLMPAGRGVGPIDPVDPPELHAQELAAAKKKLAELGVEADTVTGVGDPARVIVEIADERQADLVVVGTRSAGLFGRLFAGSVSDEVHHEAPCDVLVVR